MSAVLDAARDALEAGISLLPVRADGTKAPALAEWRWLEARRPTSEQVRTWFEANYPDAGLGLVGGPVSGGLEFIDLDDTSLAQALGQRAAETGLRELLERIGRGWREFTPNGAHLAYRCSETSGNRKLARRLKRPDEMEHANDKIKVLIETRGAGGYVITWPSGGRVHPSGRPYGPMQGSFRTIAVITPEEREALWALCASFDELPKQEYNASKNAGLDRPRASASDRPGDDFNARAAWGADVLEPCGWTAVWTHGGLTYWRRPGRNFGWSATTGDRGDHDLLWVFSTSTVFDSERGYSKFAAYTLLNHNGDFSAAARDLGARGFGVQGSAHRRNGRVVDLETGEVLASNIPEFPTGVLPDWLEHWVGGQARALQVPRTLSALATISATSVAIQRLVRVRARPGWQEPTNIYTVSSAEVGERKSAMVKENLRPLIDYEIAERPDEKVRIARAKAKHLVIKQRLEKLTRAAAQEEDEARRTQLVNELGNLAEELADVTIPVPTRLYYDNITSERLAQTLAEQNGYAAILSAEAGPFDLVLGRYTDGKVDLDVWLKAHAGDSIRVGRISRPDDYIDSPSLVVGVMIQPAVLDVLASESLLRGRGLLARFMYGICERRVGHRDTRAKPVPQDVREDYVRNVLRLLKCPPRLQDDGSSGPYVVDLDDGARTSFEDFEASLEPKLAEFAEYGDIQDWAAKLAGLVLRIAGWLHACYAASSDNIVEVLQSPINNATLESAIVVGEWAARHAQRAYELMGLDTVVARALVIRRFLEHWPDETISQRALHQKLRGRTLFRRSEWLDDPLAALVDEGFLIQEPRVEPSEQGGRPPSPVYRIVRHV